MNYFLAIFISLIGSVAIGWTIGTVGSRLTAPMWLLILLGSVLGGGFAMLVCNFFLGAR